MHCLEEQKFMSKDCIYFPRTGRTESRGWEKIFMKPVKRLREVFDQATRIAWTST